MRTQHPSLPNLATDGLEEDFVWKGTIIMKNKTNTYEVTLKTGVARSPEFEKKQLATHGVNVGLLCGHQCTYCSTPSLHRTHRSFGEHDTTAFEDGLVVVDPNSVERIKKDLHKLQVMDVVQLCTTTDAWSPECQELDLGRQCLEALLEGSRCQVRILTKNVAVANEFDLIVRHRDRVQLGLSITAAPAKSEIMQLVEPHASSNTERFECLLEADRRGIRTFGMVCPCLPGVLVDRSSLKEVAGFMRRCRAEEVFLEPVNARGSALPKTVETFAEAGLADHADAVNRIRNRVEWSRYTRKLIETAESVFSTWRRYNRLHVLLYPSGLQEEDQTALKSRKSVIWLGKEDEK